MNVDQLVGSNELRPGRDVCRSLSNLPAKAAWTDLIKSEANKFLVDDPIALARSMSEALVILDRHMSTRICDESSLAQHTGCHGDRGSARAQHHGQKFMRYRQMIALHSVVAHQQPPGQTLFEFMYPITRSRLSGLRKHCLNESL